MWSKKSSSNLYMPYVMKDNLCARETASNLSEQSRWNLDTTWIQRSAPSVFILTGHGNNSCSVKPLTQKCFPKFCQRRDCATCLHIVAAILDLWTQPPVRLWLQPSFELCEQPQLNKNTLLEMNGLSYLLSPSWSSATLSCPHCGCNTSLSKSLITHTRAHANSPKHERSALIKMCCLFLSDFIFISGPD